MEIEAKFAVTAELKPEEITGLQLAGYRLSGPRRYTQRDWVLDTDTRAITAGWHSLRVRQNERGLTLTLKGPSRIADGIAEREEWEAQLPANAELARERWPAAIAEQVRALAGDEELGPIIRLEFTRYVWSIVRDSEEIGELALDRGWIIAGALDEPLHELEIELKGQGERADLQQLGDQLCRRLPLQREVRSKLQRGLALLERSRAAAGPA